MSISVDRSLATPIADQLLDQLRYEIAEGRFRTGDVHDVALRVERRQFVIVFDARNYGTWMSIAAGDADYIALRDEWPEYNKLHDALINAIYRYGS